MRRDPAWKPAEWEPADCEAMQALSRGEANADQQRRALDWIINVAAETYDQPYRSDADGGARDTAFACGRMFVGQQIRKLVVMPREIKEQVRANAERRRSSRG